MGYSPTSGLVSNLPQAQATYFDRDFIQNLKQLTPFYRCVERRELPPQSGQNHRLYMYQAGLGIGSAFVTAQAAEGSVPSGQPPVVNTDSAVIGQYADYVNVSDYALETAIDPCVENLEREMCYRLAGSISLLVRAQADGANAIDSTVLVSKAAGTSLQRTDLTALTQELRQRSVLPFDVAANRFVGVISPLPVGDVLNDITNNSLVDIYKHTEEGLDRLLELPGGDGKDHVVPVLEFGGMRFYESPLVQTTARYQSGALTAYRTYLFGHQSIVGISLGVKENAQVGEGDWSNMKIWIMKPTEPTVGDPTRVIGGWTSYNVKLVFTLPPDTTGRLRVIDATSALT
jgi:hypothetical protein